MSGFPLSSPGTWAHNINKDQGLVGKDPDQPDTTTITTNKRELYGDVIKTMTETEIVELITSMVDFMNNIFRLRMSHSEWKSYLKAKDHINKLISAINTSNTVKLNFKLDNLDGDPEPNVAHVMPVVCTVTRDDKDGNVTTNWGPVGVIEES